MSIIRLIEYIEDEEEGATKDSQDYVGRYIEDYEEVPKDTKAIGEATNREAAIEEVIKTVKRSIIYVTKPAVS